MEKKCTKCGEVKSLDNFGRHKGHNDGKRSHCKLCIKNHNKEYYLQNKEQISLQGYKYRKENKGKIKGFHKEYYKNNKDKLKNRSRKYYNGNKGKVLEYQKQYGKNNRDTINIWNRKYKKSRKTTDPLYKLKYNISTNIRTALTKKGYTKKTKTYNILKCNYDFFMEWLNGLASNGHTYGIGELHLDHVIPISLAETEDEAILLSHYSNYQLLSADENLAKSNRYVNPTNLKRVLEHHPNPDKIREIHSRL